MCVRIMYVCMYEYVCVCMHVCMYACIIVYVLMYVCIYVCIYVYVCTIYVCMNELVLVNLPLLYR